MGRRRRSGKAVGDGDVKEEGRGEQHERDMAIPAQITAPFVMAQPERFVGFEVLLYVPASADGLNEKGERSVEWGPDEEKSQFAGIVNAAAHEKPVSTIDLTGERDGQASPVKKTLAFGTQALGEATPIAGAQGLVGDGGDIA
jgi:hypothetical protein